MRRPSSRAVPCWSSHGASATCDETEDRPARARPPPAARAGRTAPNSPRVEAPAVGRAPDTSRHLRAGRLRRMRHRSSSWPCASVPPVIVGDIQGVAQVGLRGPRQFGCVSSTSVPLPEVSRMRTLPRLRMTMAPWLTPAGLSRRRCRRSACAAMARQPCLAPLGTVGAELHLGRTAELVFALPSAR